MDFKNNIITKDSKHKLLDNHCDSCGSFVIINEIEDALRRYELKRFVTKLSSSV